MFTPFCSADLSTVPLKDKRQLLAALKSAIQQDVALSRTQKQLVKAEKRALRESKKADRIAKLEARLAALKNPVGIKAVKANRKPGKVTITKAA